MCGISVIVRPRKAAKSEIDGTRASLEKEIAASLENIKHRGPDARGVWISDDCRIGDITKSQQALGHVRLSINDLSPSGNQPFHSIDQTVHVVVNGEIYDYETLYAELSKPSEGFPGYDFTSTSDCELVLALYLKYGLNFLSYLRGEFAVCLYDQKSNTFVAARDRYGIKPLFWMKDDEGRVCVSAEVKGLLAMNGWRGEWDVRSMVEYGWGTDYRTIFKGVRKVRPGCYLIAKDGEFEEREYWDIEYPDKTIKEVRSEQEMVEGVRERLLDAIKVRLRADVPVGVYLSGGIDSSVIAGMIAHLIRERGEKLGNDSDHQRICCFSVGFDEASGFDESSIALRTAEWLGVEFIKKHMSETELAGLFEETTWHCEHPFLDLNTVGKFALSDVATTNGFKVVLTGEGADENFAGYGLYRADYLREPDHSWKAILSEDERIEKCKEEDVANGKYYNSIGADATEGAPSRARTMLNNIGTVSHMGAFSYDLYLPWAKEGMECVSNTIAENISGRAREKVLKMWHPLNSAMYVWSKAHLSNLFLSCLGDRTEMAHSLEARTPFLDHKLTEYVNGLPPSLKMRYNREKGVFVEKWALREAAKPFITNELYERVKHPYSAPISYQPDGPIHKLIQRWLTEDKVAALGFADWNKIRYLEQRSIYRGDAGAMRLAFMVMELIIISERFKMHTAEPII